MNTKLFNYRGHEYYRCAHPKGIAFGRCRKGSRSLVAVSKVEVTAAYICSLLSF